MTDLTGRALDAAIAEKLFGWTGITAGYGFPPGREDGAMMLLPRYSEEWSAMRLVVEEMQRRGWSYIFSSPDDNSRHDAWFEKWLPNGELCAPEMSADTLPEAVCLAALEAFEVSDG